MDNHAPEAEREISDYVEDVMEKYHLRYEVVYFILNNLAQNYKLKAIAKQEIDGQDK